MKEQKKSLSEHQIAQAWAQITVKLWRRNHSRMKIGKRSSGELFRLFQFKVIGCAGGDIQRIGFAFNYYGKFVDIGVDRGTIKKLLPSTINHNTSKILTYFPLSEIQVQIFTFFSVRSQLQKFIKRLWQD